MNLRTCRLCGRARPTQDFGKTNNYWRCVICRESEDETAADRERREYAWREGLAVAAAAIGAWFSVAPTQ